MTGSSSAAPADFATVRRAWRGGRAIVSLLACVAALALASPAAAIGGGEPVLVKDLGTTSIIRYLTGAGGRLYFLVSDPDHGGELWTSDGTADGTRLVKDINPGPAGSDPDNLTAVGDSLYFTAGVPGGGTGIWRSDGTAQGTVLVKDMNPSGSPSPSQFTAVGNRLYFVFRD